VINITIGALYSISALRELDIKEFYAPVEGKPLTIITSTTQKPSVTCYNNGIRSSGLP
jgi:hypothetical protein